MDIAVNHDEAAIAMHQRNHPETRHYREDVLAVDPRACGSRRGGLWMSPDCTHFLKAEGNSREKKRFAPWLTWAFRAGTPRHQRPRVIMLENVEEFQDWGRLTTTVTRSSRAKAKTSERGAGDCRTWVISSNSAR